MIQTAAHVGSLHSLQQSNTVYSVQQLTDTQSFKRKLTTFLFQQIYPLDYKTIALPYSQQLLLTALHASY